MGMHTGLWYILNLQYFSNFTLRMPRFNLKCHEFNDFLLNTHQSLAQNFIRRHFVWSHMCEVTRSHNARDMEVSLGCYTVIHMPLEVFCQNWKLWYRWYVSSIEKGINEMFCIKFNKRYASLFLQLKDIRIWYKLSDVNPKGRIVQLWN